MKVSKLEVTRQSISTQCDRLAEFENIANSEGKKIYNANLDRTIELKPSTVNGRTEESTILSWQESLSEYQNRWENLTNSISEFVQKYD